MASLYSRLEIRYANAPMSVFNIVNPRLAHSAQVHVVEHLLASCPCCLDYAFSQKLLQNFAHDKDTWLKGPVRGYLLQAAPYVHVATRDIEDTHAQRRTLGKTGRGVRHAPGLAKMTSSMVLQTSNQKHVHMGGTPIRFGMDSADIKSADDVCTWQDIKSEQQTNRLNAQLHYVNTNAKMEKQRRMASSLPRMSPQEYRESRKKWQAEYKSQESIRQDSQTSLQEGKDREPVSAQPSFASVPDSAFANNLGLGCRELPISIEDFQRWMSRTNYTSCSTAGK